MNHSIATVLAKSMCQSQFICTALMLAIMNSRADCMRLLLVSGADPEIKNVVR